MRVLGKETKQPTAPTQASLEAHTVPLPGGVTESASRTEWGGSRGPISSVIIGLLLTTLPASAQVVASGEPEPALPTAVVSVEFGEMGGRGETWLPESLLGLPDTTGRQDAGATDPKEILSLGLGGTIVLDFGDRRLVDRPGPDLVVFENPFFYTLGGEARVYAEPGEVSVSSDGTEWRSFPFDSLTFAGAAGVTPVNGDADPYDPELSGGDLFDLATIGVDSIRYVRITDVTSIIRNDRDHPLWDITLNGFDLDAVIGYHTVSHEDGLLSAPTPTPLFDLDLQ